MIKKKLFYLFGICFFVFLTPHGGWTRSFSDEIISKMNEIKEYNEAQAKNRQSIHEYTQKNSKEAIDQEEAYWDLAFHAKFADYGDKDSQYIIAKAYETGQYTAVNLKKALAFYKKAAENGHLEAAMKVGRIYLEEKWVQKDEEKALYYYLKAVKQEYAPAQMKVAALYEKNGEYEKAYQNMEAALKQMFPNEKNLEMRSPDLIRLSQKIHEDKIIEKEGSYDLSANEEF